MVHFAILASAALQVMFKGEMSSLGLSLLLFIIYTEEQTDIKSG